MLQFIIYLIIIFISIIDIIVLRLLPDHRDSIGTLLKKKNKNLLQSQTDTLKIFNVVNKNEVIILKFNVYLH